MNRELDLIRENLTKHQKDEFDKYLDDIIARSYEPVFECYEFPWWYENRGRFLETRTDAQWEHDLEEKRRIDRERSEKYRLERERERAEIIESNRRDKERLERYEREKAEKEESEREKERERVKRAERARVEREERARKRERERPEKEDREKVEREEMEERCYLNRVYEEIFQKFKRAKSEQEYRENEDREEIEKEESRLINALRAENQKEESLLMRRAIRNKRRNVGASEYDPEIMCGICMENEHDVILEPCGHYETCRNCVTQLLPDPRTIEVRCPVCRRVVTGMRDL